MALAEIDLTVYPDECDAFGHLNQASYLTLFERARWEMLARGPGMDLFDRANTVPVLRKSLIEYHAPAFPGDVLRFLQTLIHHGRTSFTMRQTARRIRDDRLVASAEFVFVCVDREGSPVPVPEAFGGFMAEAVAQGGETRRVVVNGVSLGLEVQGEGPAILFIHGYPLDRTLWRHQVANLPGFRRIAPDLRGLGRSDAPDLGYSMATYAEDLFALLDLLGVDQTVLCGLSMGGYIAFEMLRRHPERIRGLIVMDSRAEADSPDGKRGREVAAQTARERGASAIADAMLPLLLAPGTPESMSAMVERLRAQMAAAPVPGIIGALAAMRDRADSMPLLATLGSLPTLVIVGEEDQLTPPALARAMAEAIPGAELSIVPRAGHLPPIECPEETTRLIAGFLARLQ